MVGNIPGSQRQNLLRQQKFANKTIEEDWKYLPRCFSREDATSNKQIDSIGFIYFLELSELSKNMLAII